MFNYFLQLYKYGFWVFFPLSILLHMYSKNRFTIFFFDYKIKVFLAILSLGRLHLVDLFRSDLIQILGLILDFKIPRIRENRYLRLVFRKT